MSDTNYEFEEDAKDQVERNPVRAQLRNLEAKNKELEAKLLQATEAQRKLAFVEAGVDLNAPSQTAISGYAVLLQSLRSDVVGPHTHSCRFW